MKIDLKNISGGRYAARVSKFHVSRGSLKRKNKNIIFSVITALLLIFAMSAQSAIHALTYYTVSFYTNSSETELFTTQQVKQGGHPAEMTAKPPSYENGGFRYDFNGWYWMIDGRAYSFSFTDDDCEIWFDAHLFAGYTQFLADGYEMIVVYSGGTDFIYDTATPVSDILKNYPGISNVLVQEKKDYETGSGVVDPTHTHSYDYANPTWRWKVENGEITAETAYACSCGDKKTETVTPAYTDRKGVRTYTAKDNHGNTASTTKELTYTVKCDGTDQSASYHWGDICTLTSDTNKAWYVNSASPENKVADGTNSYTFAVTSDTVIVTKPTDVSSQQAVVRVRLTSDEEGKAVFNAKWSLPANADVKSVKIYRGYTSTAKTVSADSIIKINAGHDADLLVQNGDYTLYLSDLTPNYYQHAVIVITYSADGVTHTLTSTPQKVLPDGSGVK